MDTPVNAHTGRNLAIGDRCGSGSITKILGWNNYDGVCWFSYECENEKRCENCELQDVYDQYYNWGQYVAAACQKAGMTGTNICTGGDTIVWDDAADACVVEVECWNWVPDDSADGGDCVLEGSTNTVIKVEGCAGLGARTTTVYWLTERRAWCPAGWDWPANSNQTEDNARRELEFRLDQLLEDAAKEAKYWWDLTTADRDDQGGAVLGIDVDATCGNFLSWTCADLVGEGYESVSKSSSEDVAAARMKAIYPGMKLSNKVRPHWGEGDCYSGPPELQGWHWSGGGDLSICCCPCCSDTGAGLQREWICRSC